MTWNINAGSENITLSVFIKNKTLNDGSGLTGLIFNSAGLTCYYVRDRGNATVINLVTQTVTGAHADGGFVEINATNAPGLYRLDLPDAVLASGIGKVSLFLRGAANMADTVIEIQLDLVDNIWDELLTKSAHNAANSAGKLLRQTGQSFIYEGTAQGAGIGNNQIQFDTGASASNGAYDPAGVFIVGGTGTGQTRLIVQYVGATRIATVDRDWTTNPDATSEFVIFGDSGRGYSDDGLAQAGSASTITLSATASTANNIYNDQTVFIISGTGQGQTNRITAYNGTTKVATVAQSWITNPDTTSAYAIIPDSPDLFQGYQLGAIWIDTINGTPGTILYENGTPENPSSNLADARTLADTLGFSRFQVAPGSSITLAQNYDNFVFNGANWTLALGGQSIAGAHFRGASITGIGTGTGADFHDCKLGNGASVTIDANDFIECTIAGSIIMGSAGTYIFDNCYSGVAGTATPDIDFGATVGNINLNFRHYSGGIEIKNMGVVGTDTMSLEGNGQLVINANCAGGTIAIRGNFTVTDNAAGVITLSDNARIDVTQINDQVWSEIMTELTGAADIPATPTLKQAIMLLYMKERNNTQVTTTERRIFNNAGTEILDAPIADDGSLFTQGQLGDA